MCDSSFDILMGLGDRPALERSVLETFRSYRMVGASLIGVGVREREIDEFGSAVPTVVIARRVRSRAVDMIVSGDRTGARLAVEHPHELGHRDIVHLDGGRLPVAAAARRAGYVQTIKRFGLERYIRIAGGGFTLAHGANGIDELLRERSPTAIFAANDVVAMGAIERLATLGLSTPDDISIVGYDNSSLTAQRRVGLTSVDQPRLQIGELAAVLLHERLAGRTTASRHVLSPKLIERESTALHRRQHRRETGRGRR